MKEDLLEHNHSLCDYPAIIPHMSSKDKLKCRKFKAVLRYHVPNRHKYPGKYVLNGQCSCWKEILAGVPQGSILCPLLFLIFINYIPEGIQSNINIFAYDTSIISVMKNSISASATLNEDLILISKWAYS